MPTSLFIPAILALTGVGYSQTAPRAEFEVASVKVNTASAPMVRIFMAPGNPRFAATNITLRMLITFAWNVKNFQISGGNGVIDTCRYDIEAKAADAKPTLEQVKLMLQALLTDRFKLAVHRETKEVPIYAFVAAKGGTRLVESKEGGCVEFDPASLSAPGQPQRMFCGLMIGPNNAKGGKIAMKEFTDGLSNILGRPVVDKTGYTGKFDVALEFSQEGIDTVGMFAGAPFIVSKPPDDDSRPSLFTVLQDQLGLKLESQKGPAEVLVIDHAEKASGN
jgi:uncharacterized protein (TIGR03435 family)